MNRDELKKRLDDTLMLSNPRIVPNDLMPDIDAYVASQRAETEQWCAEHVRTQLAAERERITQAIEADADAVPRDVEHEPPLERGHRYGEVDALRRAARIARAEP